MKAKLNLGSMRFGKGAGADDPTVGMWEFLNTDRWTIPEKTPRGRRNVAVSLDYTPQYEPLMPQIAAMADAGSGIDLISRAPGTSADVVRDALHLHRTGQHPPRHIDPRRRRKRKPGQPPAPKYQQIAAEVNRRRNAGGALTGWPGK